MYGFSSCCLNDSFKAAQRESDSVRLGRRPSLCHESLFPLFPTALSCLGSRVDGPSGVSSCPLGPAALRRLGTPWKGGPPWSLPGATSSRQLPGQGDHPEGRGWRSRGPGGGEPVGAVNQSVSVATQQTLCSRERICAEEQEAATALAPEHGCPRRGAGAAADPLREGGHRPLPAARPHSCCSKGAGSWVSPKPSHLGTVGEEMKLMCDNCHCEAILGN